MTTKCTGCGGVWDIKHLKDNKLYWCQMCSTQHIFSPHPISAFAPFASTEEAIAFQKEMRDQQQAVYNNNRSYWRNKI